MKRALLLLCLVMPACAGQGNDTASPTAPSATMAAAPAPAPAPAPPPSAAPAAPSYDIDAAGVPRFVTQNYIELAAVRAISRFRSGIGHSYADSVESCRSMKHYFMPPAGPAAATVAIASPVDGEVVGLLQEWAGTQVSIRARSQPAFRIILFHVTVTAPLAVGTAVSGGQIIGTHVGDQTMSDVAVSVDGPDGYRLVSWFDVITDELWATYQARGLATRSDLIISRSERDQSPLSCANEAFSDSGRLENWVTLR